ncbi:60S ribosomal protein L6-like [Culex pipiens pallens]|uniref:60S ribosomal protein L6-like n=1 Tax=Culex pipiens pallens TaxID=42434 RepID=UPI0022AA256D|nr:60S ribosomal protein L6-like [Culex pipiens pallens]
MALKSGLLLVTGPFALNNCLVRCVSQNYVIATKTRVEAHQRRPLPSGMQKKTSHIEKDIFKRYVPSEQCKADQKNVDEEVLKAIKVHPEARGIRRYLRRCFPCHRHVQHQSENFAGQRRLSITNNPNASLSKYIPYCKNHQIRFNFHYKN